MSIKLRELIRNVRAAKTASEERAVITKECALIRTAFKEQHHMSSTMRSRNVAKLLFIHMLGYPSHFGQMETFKLIAAPNFSEKRVGYLALMILLDETQEVLTLATNSLKNDLKHSNQYVVGLALSALGNIGSHDMVRDLASEIDAHLRNSNPYIRKKAALCCLRIFMKVPELIEDFAERISMLINDRNHAVFLTGVYLISYIVEFSPENARHFKKIGLVKKLVKRLLGLVRSGYQPEYDIAGITDPFLQVAILRLLRLLGEGSDELSEAMSDILAQVATNTETNKNTGNSILYECVLTIMNIESESGLRVLAVNLLGRFLLNSDNNIRYVALNTLSKVVHKDITAVSRHRNTIVDCLKDPDISIRRRAMELIYSLVNETNIQPLAREMLNYLVVADTEFKNDLCSRITEVVHKFAPSPRWHIDTLITMLSIAGQHVSHDICSSIIVLISKNAELHPYIVHKLFKLLLEDSTQEALTHAGVWCIGEYGEHLLEVPAEMPDAQPVEEKRVLDVLEKSMKSYFSTDHMKAMSLTALIKLTERFTEAASMKRIKKLLGTYKTSLKLELQQRSTEYAVIIDDNKLGDSADDSAQLRSKLLERMPVIPTLTKRQDSKAGAGFDMDDSDSDSGSEEDSDDDASDDDDDDDDDEDDAAPAAAPAPAAHDDLLDLLSGDPEPAAAGAAGGGGGGLLDDLFGGGGDALGGGGGDMFGAATPQYPTLTAYSGNGFSTIFSFTKASPQDNTTTINIRSTNATQSEITNFVVHAAVPKYLKIIWSPASGNRLGPGGSEDVTQQMQLQNSHHGNKKIVMRLKIEFTINGTPSSIMQQVENFPAALHLGA